MRTRIAIGAAGGLMLLWGIRLVLGLDLSDLLSAGLWLAGGVIVHDAVIAPAVAVVGIGVARLLPPWAAGPFAAVGVVVGTITLAVVPMLGRFGAKSDDPYLLNREYGAWWLLLTTIALITGVVVALRARRAHDAADASAAAP